jgi:hypothetical protein
MNRSAAVAHAFEGVAKTAKSKGPLDLLPQHIDSKGQITRKSKVLWFSGF